MYLGTIPQRSTIFEDKAYTSQALEEKLLLSKDNAMCDFFKKNLFLKK